MWKIFFLLVFLDVANTLFPGISRVQQRINILLDQNNNSGIF